MGGERMKEAQKMGPGDSEEKVTAKEFHAEEGIGDMNADKDQSLLR
jgi:hypothetical protein